jgi:hypothetical protein
VSVRWENGKTIARLASPVLRWLLYTIRAINQNARTPAHLPPAIIIKPKALVHVARGRTALGKSRFPNDAKL